MNIKRQQNTVTYPVSFLMVDSTDHTTGKTGLSPTITVGKNGGTFSAASGSVVEQGNGIYAFSGNATDRNTLGTLSCVATASGADPAPFTIEIVSYDPFLYNTSTTDIATAVWASSTRTLSSFGTLASDTATAVWASGTRTLTSFGTLVADTTTAVWGAGTRTLTSFGTLVADTATAVWASGTRTLTSFGTLVADIADAVWDERLTVATHNVPTSSGRRLRQVGINVIYSGTVVSATENTVTLDSGASSVNGAYDPSKITITDGSGEGQTRNILEYIGATRTCVVDRNWKTTPVLGDGFDINADAGREHVNEGLARGGTTNTITLNANASSYTNAYVGQVIFIRSGYGEDQACRVTAYDGTTKIATIAKDWLEIPNTTSAYVVLPTSILDLNMFIQNIWSYSTRSLTTFGTLVADVTTAVWGAGTRTLTSFGTLVADVATAVWGSTTRTLSSFGTLVADIWANTTRTLTSGGSSLTAQQVWEYASRTLSSFGFTVATNSDSNITDIKAKTDNLPVNPASQTNLDVAVSTRLSSASYVVPPTVGDISTSVWENTVRTLTSSGSELTAKEVWEYVNRTLTSSPSELTAQEVWEYANRTLTAFGFTVTTTSDGNITAIKAKTDNLPTNPASQTNLDVAVSTRLASASYTTPPSVSDITTGVWGATTRTLSSFGTLVVDISDSVWAHSYRTLTSFGTALTGLATSVWSYANRTLTSSLKQSAIQDNTIRVIRGDTLSYIFENIVLSDVAKIYFTSKSQYKNSDEESMIQIDNDSGLLYLNGVEQISGVGAVITYDEGLSKIELIVEAEITKQFSYISNNYVYDIEVIKLDGTVETPVIGEFIIVRDVTLAVE